MDVARAEALEDLRSDRYRRLLADLVDGARAPRLTPAADRPAGEALPPLVDKAWRRLEKDVDRLTLEGASETWHKARIHAKRARYAVEAVAPVFGKPAQRLAAQLERVTELLGEHQDAYVAQGTVRELSAHDDVDGATGFSLGLLHSFEVEQEILDRVRFEEVWPEVRRTYRRTRLVPADRHGGRGAKRRRKG
jgi:CHAD domain-containing protein